MTETGRLVRDVLNIKKTDFFVSYGLSHKARDVVDFMRDVADVSTGIALDNVQYEESEYLRTPIYRGLKELGAKQLFERVYCDYESVPASQKNIESVFSACYELCQDGGMVLMTGVNDWISVENLLEAAHIYTHWFLRETDFGFDLLYKKPKYKV